MAEDFDSLLPEQPSASNTILTDLVAGQPPTPKKGLPRKPYTYGLLNLSSNEAAWLAAIIDGEGSVCINTYIRKSGYKRNKPMTVVRMAICYNIDYDIIAKAANLVPWANIRICIPSGFSAGKKTKPCYSVETAQRSLIYDLLTKVLPYLAHSAKINKAKEILAYVESTDLYKAGIV